MAFSESEEEEAVVEVEEEYEVEQEEEEEEEEEEAVSAYSAVAASVGLTPKDVKGAVESYLTLAAKEMNKSGNAKLAGMLMLKRKKIKVTKSFKGTHPLTKKPCVYKASASCMIVQAIPMQKWKEIVKSSTS